MTHFSNNINVTLMSTNASDQYLQTILATTNSSSTETPLIESIDIIRDSAILEHLTFTFRIVAPVYVFRALMDQRYLSYYPNPGINRVFSGNFYIPQNISEVDKKIIMQSCSESYTAYQSLLKSISPDIARLILPINTYSDMLVTMNLKELIYFLEFITVNKSDELNKIKHGIYDILIELMPQFYGSMFY